MFRPATLLTDTAAQVCAAFFDRPAYPAPHCTFQPPFALIDMATLKFTTSVCDLAP